MSLAKFLGGTCGDDLKCLTCNDGASPGVDGLCPTTACSGIANCEFE